MSNVQTADDHKTRISGISGRTAGLMFRAHKSTPSRTSNGLRQKTALKPMGKNRFPGGFKYTTMAGEPIPGC